MDMTDIEAIAKKAIDNAIREMVTDTIETNTGYGIESEIKAAIKEKALEIFNHDVELQKLLKERMIYWIATQ